MSTRDPLSVASIIDATVQVADAGGYAAISMRSVGRQLGVEAMSLYHHIDNKDALLDALADWLFAQFARPGLDEPWRDGMRRRAESVRDTLSAHPWALNLIDSRAHPGPALLLHHESVIGCLRRGGFSVALAAQAFSVIDAYIYGFALTERNLPFDPASGEGAIDVATEMLPALADFPAMAELVVHLTGSGSYAFSDQFGDGLDIILDQLEVRRAREAQRAEVDAP